MKNIFTLYLIIVTTFLLLNSCIPQSCTEKTVSLAGATFYRTGTGKIEAPDTVFLYCLKDDSQVFYEKVIKKNVIYLPLDASTEKCDLILKINQTTDTLTFDYSTFPFLISKECGYILCFSITDCKSTKNIIDTIVVVNNRVTNKNEENLRIFY